MHLENVPVSQSSERKASRLLVLVLSQAIRCDHLALDVISSFHLLPRNQLGISWNLLSTALGFL